MTEQEMIEVLKKSMCGKRFQSRCVNLAGVPGEWMDDPNPVWDFARLEYREKPGPFECWVNLYANKIMAHTNKNDALGHSGDSFIRCAVHMREVE